MGSLQTGVCNDADAGTHLGAAGVSLNVRVGFGACHFAPKRHRSLTRPKTKMRSCSWMWSRVGGRARIRVRYGCDVTLLPPCGGARPSHEVVHQGRRGRAAERDVPPRDASRSNHISYETKCVDLWKSRSKSQRLTTGKQFKVVTIVYIVC
jgi:hypothetical protein